MNKKTLSEMVPVEVLQDIQDAFSEYSGLAAIIADANGVPVTKQSGFTEFCKLTRASECGSRECQRCGREGAHKALESGKSAVYRCHTGMVDFSAPIMLDDTYIGHFAGGQTRVAQLDEEFVRERAREYDIDEEKYLEAARKNNETDWERVERSAKFLSNIAKAFSRLAYERAQILEKKEQIEETARTQMDFLRDYAKGANTSMQDFVDFLQRIASGEVNALDENERDFISEMTSRMQGRISSINESLLKSEINRGEVSIHENTYDVRMMVDRKCSELKGLYENDGRSISYHIESDVPVNLVGDAVAISEIIDNAVVCAINYSGAENIEINISSAKKGYGVRLKIDVIDDGENITKEAARGITEYIKNRDSETYSEDDFDYKEISEIGHLLDAMSGQAQVSVEEKKGCRFTAAIPQLEA